MSPEIYYSWVLPLSITAVGVVYALWAAWAYDRGTARDERERRAAAGE